MLATKWKSESEKIDLKCLMVKEREGVCCEDEV
jgi:hypothetical protein